MSRIGQWQVVYTFGGTPPKQWKRRAAVEKSLPPLLYLVMKAGDEGLVK